MIYEGNVAEQLPLLDDIALRTRVSVAQFTTPQGYKGLAAFHKYWGKKPIECISFLIEALTNPNEVVVDPFLGSGLVARESLLRERSFLGIDVNPIAIEISKLQLELPDPVRLRNSLVRIENKLLTKINATYALADSKIATHFLWNESELTQVWIAERGKGGRIELAATKHDYDLSKQYEGYTVKHLRALKIFKNSRINACESFTWEDLFTGRALYNIDLIISAIQEEPTELRRALMLSLTSAAGQMSKMVFAITGRGKNSGNPSTKIEVGSWVIGFWRPKLHFEINVWRCFEKRVKSLIKASSETSGLRRLPYTSELKNLSVGEPKAVLLNADCKSTLEALAENSVALILTDPPHSDRIPYLELSEIWNALLGSTPAFEQEIIVSNAKARGKSKKLYTDDMKRFVNSAVRVLKPGRFLALMFNARDSASWKFLSDCIQDQPLLELCGSVPMAYSAGSVVQDNRKGSLKSDYVLLYRKKGVTEQGVNLAQCMNLPGWNNELPERVIESTVEGEDE